MNDSASLTSTDITDKTFVVVGLTRNAERVLSSDIKILQSAFGNAKRLHWHLIESDSTDGTVDRLAALANEVKNFSFESLGNLRATLPQRTVRIAHCRNRYLEAVRDSTRFEQAEYVVICDFDGVNAELKAEGVASCWNRTDWDVCTANQTGPYYDLWALRHQEWCPGDCWAEYRFLLKHGLSDKKAFFAAIQSRMIRLSPDSDWLEVDSAFGGLAIYRRDALKFGQYVGLNKDGEEFCEHVPLHTALRSQGRRILINPRLINASYTDYTRQLRPLNSLLKTIKQGLRSGLPGSWR